MGIPSYFKHILDRYPHLLRPTGADTKANCLLVDFNCLIYGCIGSKSLPPYSHVTRNLWEEALLKEICSYVTHLWTISGKPEQVLLAVDGVVPMAKIKQQRLRRFKSVWLTAKERELGARPVSEETWDTNSITPGTEFMEKLTTHLLALARTRGAGWTVSGAEKPGEGEQKLMEWVRGQKGNFDGKHIVVYGLDADLILLCMLHATTGAWSILREKQEFIKRVVPNLETKYPVCLLMSINGFQDVLFPNRDSRLSHLHDYIAGMSLLGNDFIPHSLGIHLRDAGHDRLTAILALIHSESMTLVEKGSDGLLRWNHVALQHIFKFWAQTEEGDLEHAFKKKYTMRPQVARTVAEQCMLPVQNMPLAYAEEERMWNRMSGKLYPDWKERYVTEKRLRPVSSYERCTEYCRGLQWTLDYYTGQRPINQEWMYPWTYPPLWSELLDFTQTHSLPDSPAVQGLVLQPQEQLTLVLPLDSWNLIRNPILKSAPSYAPHFWPKSFTFSTLGKRWMWECPPEIPILTIRRLLALTNRAITKRV